MAEKQSALYSAQRQLKTCRQTLESKELYLGLLQKKTASLEERVQSFSHREAQLETLGSKVPYFIEFCIYSSIVPYTV